MNNTVIKNMLNNMGNVGQTFMELLDYDDAKFQAFYKSYKPELLTALNSPKYKESLRQELQLVPIEDIESEKKGIEMTIEDIKKDTELSEDKKDFLITILDKSALQIYYLVTNPAKRVQIKIMKTHENAVIPKYANVGDAGMDIYAIEETTIEPKTTVIIPTGLRMAIPIGYEIQIRPRSGMSCKTKIRVANSIGTIDSGYRGDIGIIFDNIGDTPYTINVGDRIAQMVLNEVPVAEFQLVDELDETSRGNGGFGSTGK